MWWCIQILNSNQIIPIFTKLIFGKDSACNIILKHPKGSRQHFQITSSISSQGKDALHISDLGSSQGTFVNGILIQEDESPILKHSDIITYGSSKDETFKILEYNGVDDKIDKAREKLLRLKLESERIRSKDSSGLTEGQERTLARNESEINNIEQMITNFLQSHFELFPNSENKNEQDQDDDDIFGKSLINEEENEYNMLDLTSKPSSSTNNVQTYDSLLLKINELNEEAQKLETEISNLQKEQQSQNEEEVDELDLFMFQNEQSLKSSDLEKKFKKLQQIKEERTQCETLANIAKPAVLNEINPKSSSFSIINKEESEKNSNNNPKKQDLNYKLVHTTVDEIFKDRESKKSKPLIFEEKPIENRKEEDPIWIPPKNQKGDGNQKKNEKYGY